MPTSRKPAKAFSKEHKKRISEGLKKFHARGGRKRKPLPEYDYKKDYAARSPPTPITAGKYVAGKPDKKSVLSLARLSRMKIAKHKVIRHGISDRKGYTAYSILKPGDTQFKRFYRKNK